MIHLWATAGSGRYPVCGASGATKGSLCTSAFYRDLCKACIAYQERKSLHIKHRLRRERGES